MTTFITLCVAGYLLWTAAYLLYERHERRKRQRESEETLPRKVADAEEILGKSTFSLCHSTPQVPEKTETVKPKVEADTFAAESERYPKVVSADELDALFAEGGLEPVEGQDEPMEYRDTDAGEPPIDEDKMLEGHAPKAAGLRFEDMGLAVRVAMDDRTATDEERQQAGRALAERIKGHADVRPAHRRGRGTGTAHRLAHRAASGGLPQAAATGASRRECRAR